MIKRLPLCVCSLSCSWSSRRCKKFISRTSRNVTSYNLLNILWLKFSLVATVPVVCMNVSCNYMLWDSFFLFILKSKHCSSIQKSFANFENVEIKKLFADQTVMQTDIRASLFNIVTRYYKFKSASSNTQLQPVPHSLNRKLFNPSRSFSNRIFQNLYRKSNGAWSS